MCSLIHLVSQIVFEVTMCVHAKLLQSCPTLRNPMNCSHQAPQFMGFSRQYWSGLPCPPPGDLPDSGIKLTSLTSPALAGGFFTTSSTWEVQGSTLSNPFNLITSSKTLSSNTDFEVLRPNTSTYVLWETIQPI